MRKSILALGLTITALSLIFPAGAHACGDKFLVPGKVPQFDQAYAATNPGRVLLFRDSGSEVASKVMTEDLRATLERVGHVVEVVENATELRKAIVSNEYDIVMVDAAEIEAIETPGNALLLPVVYEAPWTEVLRLRETYSVVVNAPSRTSQLLSTIEEAIVLRRQAG